MDEKDIVAEQYIDLFLNTYQNKLYIDSSESEYLPDKGELLYASEDGSKTLVGLTYSMPSKSNYKTAVNHNAHEIAAGFDFVGVDSNGVAGFLFENLNGSEKPQKVNYQFLDCSKDTATLIGKGETDAKYSNLIKNFALVDNKSTFYDENFRQIEDQKLAHNMKAVIDTIFNSPKANEENPAQPDNR